MDQTAEFWIREFWDLMDDFSKYEFIIRNFILIQGGCDTELVKPFRIDEKCINIIFPNAV